MISKHSYSKAWIESFRRQKAYRAVNPPLFEKMIYAFSLLEMLVVSGLDFIFKGGTSLLLMPVNSDRFSVDIDILTEMPKETLEQSIEKTIGGSVFTSYSEDKRRANTGGIPKAHYVFSFNAVYNRRGNILLDVLFDKNPYASLSEVEIQCKWIETTLPVLKVKVPSVNSILGDKLTAFAPNTTGIPYWLNNPDNPDKRLEIIKQLYDVSKLIDSCSNIKETKRVFEIIAAQQIKYRNLTATIEDVMEDIFKTALVLAKRQKNTTEPEKSYFLDMQAGIRMLEGHLISTKFRIEDAIIAAAKAAWFIQSIMLTTENSFKLYQADSDVFDKDILNTEFNFMNRFKKTNRQAYFYWYKCLELMNLVK